MSGTCAGSAGNSKDEASLESVRGLQSGRYKTRQSQVPSIMEIRDQKTGSNRRASSLSDERPAQGGCPRGRRPDRPRRVWTRPTLSASTTRPIRGVLLCGHRPLEGPRRLRLPTASAPAHTELGPLPGLRGSATRMFQVNPDASQAAFSDSIGLFIDGDHVPNDFDPIRGSGNREGFQIAADEQRRKSPRVRSDQLRLESRHEKSRRRRLRFGVLRSP